MQPRSTTWIRAARAALFGPALALVLAACNDAPGDGAAYRCDAPPADLAACLVDADCATVARGCYCGAQPVNGVATKYAEPALACEQAAASSCALGCANEPGEVAQDGKKVAAGAAIAVRCDHSAGAGTCMSYVP